MVTRSADSGQALSASDRNTLIKILKARGEQAKRDVVERETILRAEVEQNFHIEFSRRDDLWADVVAAVEEAEAAANVAIQARCAALGLPAEHVPTMHSNLYSRRYSKEERTDLRVLADKRLKAMTAEAKGAIDRAVLDRTEQLLIGGLSSHEARAVIDAMPRVQELMPALSLDDLGVRTWQPPVDAAQILTAGLDPVERRRRQIRYAIESNPGASDRYIGQLLGVDHKTVGKYRRGLGQVGELPGESPADEAAGGESVGNSPSAPDGTER
jgi:hypothetical protein